jgi:hypothetical protein
VYENPQQQRRCYRRKIRYVLTRGHTECSEKSLPQSRKPSYEYNGRIRRLSNQRPVQPRGLTRLFRRVMMPGASCVPCFCRLPRVCHSSIILDSLNLKPSNPLTTRSQSTNVFFCGLFTASHEQVILYPGSAPNRICLATDGPTSEALTSAFLFLDCNFFDTDTFYRRCARPNLHPSNRARTVLSAIISPRFKAGSAILARLTRGGEQREITSSQALVGLAVALERAPAMHCLRVDWFSI